jgi:hypothetical protein
MSTKLFLVTLVALCTVSNAFVLGPRVSFVQKQRVGAPLFFFNFGGNKADDPDRFVKEIFTMDKLSSDTSKYDALVQYVKEWAGSMMNPGNGLTTPIKVQVTDDGVQITFAPKQATGKKYRSADEEKESEKKGLKKKTGNEPQEEGGVEIFVLGDDSLSVQAKRFNYGEDVSVKEMSEETIVSKLKEALIVWKGEQK